MPGRWSPGLGTFVDTFANPRALGPLESRLADDDVWDVLVEALQAQSAIDSVCRL